jgi:hypothetical protein
MPCNTMTRVKLELKKANMDLLKKAVEGIYGRVYVESKDRISWSGGSYDRNTGMLTVRSESEGNGIRRAYSTEIVTAQAKRFGWTMKQTGTNQYEVVKR